MLGRSGGQDRIAAHAAALGVTVDAAALHAAKSRHFAARLAKGVPLRDGVAQAMDWAAGRGIEMAFASSTAPGIVDGVLAATALDRRRFAVVLDARDVARSKPATGIDHVALERLGLAPHHALAVEDDRKGLAADLSCITFPGALHDPAAFAGRLQCRHGLALQRCYRARDDTQPMRGMSQKVTHVEPLPPPRAWRRWTSVSPARATWPAIFDARMIGAVAAMMRNRIVAKADVVRDGETARASRATCINDRDVGFEGDGPRKAPADIRRFPGCLDGFVSLGGALGKPRQCAGEWSNRTGARGSPRPVSGPCSRKTRGDRHVCSEGCPPAHRRGR